MKSLKSLNMHDQQDFDIIVNLEIPFSCCMSMFLHIVSLFINPHVYYSTSHVILCTCNSAMQLSHIMFCGFVLDCVLQS